MRDILEVIGYIAIAVVVGVIGICIKESVGWLFDALIIVLGWGFLIWIWTKN